MTFSSQVSKYIKKIASLKQPNYLKKVTAFHKPYLKSVSADSFYAKNEHFTTHIFDKNTQESRRSRVILIANFIHGW